MKPGSTDLSNNGTRKRLSQIADAATGTRYCWDCHRHRSVGVFAKAQKAKRPVCNDCAERIRQRGGRR